MWAVENRWVLLYQNWKTCPNSVFALMPTLPCVRRLFQKAMKNCFSTEVRAQVSNLNSFGARTPFRNEKLVHFLIEKKPKKKSLE